MTYSARVGESILRLTELVSDDTKLPDLRIAITTMGPGCLFDDFRNDDEIEGAMKVLNWIESMLRGEKVTS